MTSVATAKPPCIEGRGMAHHWQYTTPSGPTVVGRCKHCGAARRDRVDPLAGGSWSDYHGIEKRKYASDYFPTALQERDR